MAKHSKIACFRKPLIGVLFAALLAFTFLMMPTAKAAEVKGVVKRCMFENWEYSASLYAQSADMYMCHVDKASRIAQIHQVKSSLICLIYRNIRSVRSGSSEYQTALSNNWILKDKNGVKLYSSEFAEYIVDKGNTGYQQWVANWVKTNLDKYGGNGLFADCILYPTIGEACWGTNWQSGQCGPPINPKTGAAYTDAQWKSAEIALINKIKDTITPRLIIGNGIFTGDRFFQRAYSDILLGSKIDGLMSEGWISTRSTSAWYSESKWKSAIDFAVWLETNFLKLGKKFIPVSENAETNDDLRVVLPSGVTKEQYVTYCFSSLMLAASTSNSHYMNLGHYMPQTYPQSLFQIDFGTPQNSYYMVSGTHVYSRDFSNIKVLVNPTSTSYKVSLTGQYQTLSGQTVTSPVTVNPHTGLLLKVVGGTPPPPPPPPTGVIFNSGFETGNFGEWTGTSTTSGETASVVRTLPHDGTYHARFTTDGTSSFARSYCYKTITSVSQLYASAYVRIDTGLPLSNWNALWLFQFRDASGNSIASFGVKAGSSGTRWACMYGSQTAFAASGPQLDTWYQVEAFFKKAASGKTLAVYVNGQEVASLSVSTSAASNVAQVRLGIAYNDPSYVFNLYVDTVTIDDQYI